MRFIAAAFALALLAPAFSANAAVDQTAYTDPSIPIVTKVGNDFLIVLQGNRTTGYTWVASVRGGAVVNEGNAYRANAHAPGIVGSGGEEIFLFDAAHRGSATIVFRYVQPWIKNPVAGQTSTFKVTVR
jgi:predicted secreted protein